MRVVPSKERVEIGTGLYVSRQAALTVAIAVGRESSDSERGGVLIDVVRLNCDMMFIMSTQNRGCSPFRVILRGIQNGSKK